MGWEQFSHGGNTKSEPSSSRQTATILVIWYSPAVTMAAMALCSAQSRFPTPCRCRRLRNGFRLLLMAMDRCHAPVSTQYRRFGTDPSRPAARFSKTPPQFSMTLAEPRLSSSQVTSTRPRPIDDATARDWRMMAVA